MTTNDRDAMIRLALRPAPDVHAPADLADAIYEQIIVTPQRRGLVRLGRLGFAPALSPQLAALGILALLAVALVIVALSRQPSVPILSTYHGGPDRTGVMPGPGPVGTPVVEWDVARPGGLSGTSMPLPSAGRVFVADVTGGLAALDAATGAVLWEVEIGSAIRGSPALFGDLLVVGSEAGDVVAVHAVDGTSAWLRPLGNGPVVGSVLVADGVVFAGGEAGLLFALDAATGTVLWSVEVGGAVTRGPSASNRVVFVGAAGGRLSAIDARTQAVRWAIELGPGEVGTPTVGGGRVYAGRGILGEGAAHDLVAVDEADGSIEWTFASPTGEQVHMGGLDAGVVFASSEDGNVYALDAATGKVRWTADAGGRVTTLTAIVDETIYVTSADRSVRAIDATTGILRWRVEVIGQPTMAAVTDGRVFVGTDLGRVIAIGGSAEPSVR